MTAFIPALLIKLTLILALGLVLAATLRRVSPSLRHVILLATLAGGLVLPVIMLVSPQWNVAVLPESVTRSATISRPIAEPNDLVSGAGISDAQIPRSPIAVSETKGDGQVTIDAAKLLWALGFIAALCWLAIGRIRLRRIAAESWPLDGSGWREILEEERTFAGVTRPVLLFSSSIVSTPLTWGWRSPIVLLPEDAIDWPEAHRRIVLRHELAHIARSDSLTQLVAAFACAVYWFHPLAWVAERRLRAECERACDDTVVSLGTPAAEYAAHLLEVARSARAFGAPGFLSVAMARPSQLEGRLLAVLNESRRRVSVSPWARPFAALLAAVILIPLAAFRAVPRAGERAETEPAPSASIAADKSVGAAASPQAATPMALVKTTPKHTEGDASEDPIYDTPTDSTFQLSVPARSGGTLTIDLRSGGRINIKGWDKPEVSVRVSLGGRDWRETAVRLEPAEGGARLESDFTTGSRSRSTSHNFEINVPRRYEVRISSSGGSITISALDGTFTGNTGGGEIDITNSSGEVDMRTGGGKIHVSDSRLNGTVRTGGGTVTIERVTGNLHGMTGGGSVFNSSSGATTTTYTNPRDGRVVASGRTGIRMSTGGGPITLPSAPEGAHVTTGGGKIRIGPSGGQVYAQTGGGSIDIGPATGSVEAHTGAGDVSIELKGAGAHAVDVTSGKGEVVLVLPSGLDATLELETAYTNNLGHKTRIISDLPVQITETDNWDDRQGTPRKYVRARQTVGRGGPVIRVRTVNGNIVVKRS